MIDTFVDLHTHSTYSPMDGVGTAEQVRDRLIELSQTAMGLCDHGVSTGHPEFFRVFKEAGLKLVPGIEFYHCADLSQRGVKSETNQEGQRVARASLPHLTVLALNQIGYRNLLALHKLSYRTGFYYRPRIDTPALVRHQKGLVVLSGCVGGQIARLINADKEDLAFQWLRYFQQNIEHFYAEITPITGLSISERHCRVLWKMAEELKLPRVVTSDAHFPRPQDYAAEDTMTARAIGTTVDAPDRKLRLPTECYHCTGDEIMARLRAVLPDVPKIDLLTAIVRSKAIASMCEVEPPRASGPIFQLPLGLTTEDLLWKWIVEGFERRKSEGSIPAIESLPIKYYPEFFKASEMSAGGGRADGQEMVTHPSISEALEKPITSTDFSTPSSEETSTSASTSTTSAVTTPASIHGISSPLPKKKISDAVSMSEGGRETKPNANAGTPSPGTISSPAPQGEEFAEAAARISSKDGATPTANSSGSEIGNSSEQNESVYLKRVKYEWKILQHHGFLNYCLVVADIVRWAREENILCIARGSCGGSLLAWYLGITELNPIKYDLPVERFIGFHRKSLPDIDLDVDARHRDRFWKYLTQKYGEENCAQIAALSRFRARQALRDVAAAHSLPDEALVAMLDLVPEAAVADEGLKAVGTLRRLFAENDRAQVLTREYPAFLIAAELEGQIRQSTTHAAGFVVDARPIHETVGIMGKPDTLPIAACDMVEAEHLGLLKIDLLAVDMLSVLASVTEGLGHDLNWLRALPLDDAATYEMLGEGHNAGVFQLQGNAAGRLMRDLQPTQFQDICNITALARPGPLQSGGAQSFVARQRGHQPRLNLHPILDAILAPTQDIVLYQEQVMRVAREAGQYDWPEVEAIRKTVSKIEGAAAMKRFLDGYLMGCRKQNIPERDALLVWDQCCKSGNYSFNAAHGYAYAKIAIWSAYLKRHYPARFAAAFAQFEEDPDLRRRIFNEFRDLGGKFVLIDPNRSQAHFTAIDDRTILGGFQDLEGCGPKNATKLLAGQPYACWDAFYQACPKTVRDYLHATGIHEGRVDQDAVLHVAPWYVEITYTDLERAAFQRMSATTVAATHHADRQVSLVGRVTQVQIINVVAEAKKYGQRPPGPGEPTTRAVVTLADETGSTLLHVSPRRLEQLVAQRKPLRGPYEGVGNSVYAACSWNRPHTKLYCEDLICFREAPLFVPATPQHLDPVLTKKLATRKRKKKTDEIPPSSEEEASHVQPAIECRAGVDNGRPVQTDLDDRRDLQDDDADREKDGNTQGERGGVREAIGGNLRGRGAAPDPFLDSSPWE